MHFAPNDDIRRPHKVAARLICGTAGTLGLFTTAEDYGICCEIWSNIVISGDAQDVKHLNTLMQIGDSTIPLYGDARLNAIRLLEKDFQWQRWLEGEKRLAIRAELDLRNFEARQQAIARKARKNKTETV